MNIEEENKTKMFFERRYFRDVSQKIYITNSFIYTFFQ